MPIGNFGYRGPQLPRALQDQLTDSAGSGRGGTGARHHGSSRGGGRRGGARGGGRRGGARGGGGRSGGALAGGRKEARKQARHDKKAARFQGQRAAATHRHALLASTGGKEDAAAGTQPAAPRLGGTGSKRKEPPPLAMSDTAAKRSRVTTGSGVADSGRASSRERPTARQARAVPDAAVRTRFFDMLEADGVTVSGGARLGGAAGRAAFQADAQLQRDMARRLKLKKGSVRSGPEDGLDGLLDGISAGDDAGGHGGLGSSSDDMGSGLGSSSDDMGSGGGESALSGDNSSGDTMGSIGSGGSSDDGVSDVDGDDSDIDSIESDQDGDGSDGDGSDHSSDSQSDDGSAGSSGSLGSGSSGDGQQPPAAAIASRGLALGATPQALAAATTAAAGSSGARYLPPALRGAAAAQDGGKPAARGGAQGGGLSPAAQRRVTGLLNRLGEANLPAIAADLLALYHAEGRRGVSDAMSGGLISAVAEGPRSTEQFAALAAAFVAGLAGSARAQDVAARFLETLAFRLQSVYEAGDGLASHNLTLLLAYAYSAGLVAADCLFSLLSELTRRFTEADVSMMLTLLNAVGLQLRAADPSAMKAFVLAVHARAAEAAAAGGPGLSKRAELMLELVLDIKNNRARAGAAAAAAASAAATAGGAGKRGAAAAAAAAGRGGAAAVLPPHLLRWLKECGVARVTLANLSWAKLIVPHKVGMWWLPSATDAAEGLLPGLLAEQQAHDACAGHVRSAAATDDDGGPETLSGPGGSGGGDDAASLLALAGGMRMNTDARRAVFVAIMGSEDCAQASERLLRLPLRGEQSREVVRVLVECALQEAAPNPYYAHLAARLAAVSKAHKVTLQYSLWDQWKEVTSTEPRRLLCLASFVGRLLAGFTLPLSALKPVDFDAAGSWTARETFLWRHTLRATLESFAADSDADAAFTRLAGQAALGSLARGLGSFLKLRLGPWLVAQADAGLIPGQELDICLRRLAHAERTLLNSAAAVLATPT